MSANSHIEWTEATWNPVTGCTKVSPGCDHCYIERTPPFRMAHRKFDRPGIGGTTGVQLHPERLDQPLRWRKPKRIFVNSLSDLFHEDVTDEYIANVFAIMLLAPQHTFQILTKRHARMRSLLSRESFRLDVQDIAYLIKYPLDQVDSRANDRNLRTYPLPNVWIGVTVENQQWADIRIPALLDTPAVVRFLSCEPLLGPVDLVGRMCGQCEDDDPELPMCSACYGRLWVRGIDWVICGGESGPGARPMDPDWARSLRDQCTAAGIPFHFKQWGEWYDGERLGKREAGRILDGRTWDEYPQQKERTS